MTIVDIHNILATKLGKKIATINIIFTNELIKKLKSIKPKLAKAQPALVAADSPSKTTKYVPSDKASLTLETTSHLSFFEKSTPSQRTFATSDDKAIPRLADRIRELDSDIIQSSDIETSELTSATTAESTATTLSNDSSSKEYRQTS